MMIINRKLIKKLKDEEFARQNNLPHVNVKIFSDGWGYINVKNNTVDEKIMKKVLEDTSVQKKLKLFEKRIIAKMKKDSHYGYNIGETGIYVDCKKGEEYNFAMDILEIYFDHIEFYKERMNF